MSYFTTTSAPSNGANSAYHHHHRSATAGSAMVPIQQGSVAKSSTFALVQAQAAMMVPSSCSHQQMVTMQADMDRSSAVRLLSSYQAAQQVFAEAGLGHLNQDKLLQYSMDSAAQARQMAFDNHHIVQDRKMRREFHNETMVARTQDGDWVQTLDQARQACYNALFSACILSVILIAIVKSLPFLIECYQNGGLSVSLVFTHLFGSITPEPIPAEEDTYLNMLYKYNPIPSMLPFTSMYAYSAVFSKVVTSFAVALGCGLLLPLASGSSAGLILGMLTFSLQAKTTLIPGFWILLCLLLCMFVAVVAAVEIIYHFEKRRLRGLNYTSVNEVTKSTLLLSDAREVIQLTPGVPMLLAFAGLWMW